VVDLVIWPENSVDVDIGANSDVSTKIINLSSQIKTPLLVSGVQKNTYGRQNQAILFDPQIKQIYTKRYLTPFGEYIPLRAIAEKVSKYTSQVNDISAGKVNTIFKIQNAKFQSLICYELIDDRLIRQVESDFLVIQTNNATFGDTPQLDQQLNIARVRAAEISRYLPYVSTTGVTSFIGPQGEIISQVQKFEPATLFGEVAKASGVTYAQKYGRYLEFIAIFGSIGLLLLRRKGSR
jgi:apolipoprotein N-acyltransferase